VAVNAAIKK
jgi:hypothetical protein